MSKIQKEETPTAKEAREKKLITPLKFVKSVKDKSKDPAIYAVISEANNGIHYNLLSTVSGNKYRMRKVRHVPAKDDSGQRPIKAEKEYVPAFVEISKEEYDNLQNTACAKYKRKAHTKL